MLSASFAYDALGRRIQKTISVTDNLYLYDGLDIIQERNASGTVTANYMRTLNIDEPLARIKADGTIRFYQRDALGSIIALTDEIGTVKTQYSYDPFGNVTVTGEASDNPFQYTGRENDQPALNGVEGGLYYYRARYYSPELQRFISEDPIGLAGGINQFAYVGNNPVNFVDPEGENSLAIGVCTLVLVGGVMVAVCNNHTNNMMREGTLWPSWPEDTSKHDCSNTPEACKLWYDYCMAEADQADGAVRRAAKKAKCFAKFLICLAGTAL